MTNSATTFDSTKQSLTELLKDIKTGKIQLPDFQRGWVWDDDHIISLVASISLSFPVGTIMLLETGNQQVHFKPRLVEGVTSNGISKPDNLILDGQQRLTSLFQALYSDSVVETHDARKKKIKRWYYIDINIALDDTDREEAIISLPEDRKIRNFRGEVMADYSTPEKEYQQELFPLSRIFNSSEWRWGYEAFWDHEKNKGELFSRFEQEVIERFKQYLVPLIMLKKETPKEAVCQVFEKVNTGGVSLTVFELLTATFAADNFDLREDWTRREKQLQKEKVLAGLQSGDALQAIALLTTHSKRNAEIARGTIPDNAPGISCKRKEILSLEHEEYSQWAERVTSGFEKAARLLRSQRIFDDRDLPYRTQLVPLAAVFAALGDAANKDSVRTKLIRWYWCGVFGELYASAVETRFAKDLPEILNWIKGGDEPTTIKDAQFRPERLLTLKTRNSAAYKGLSALLLRNGGLDFITGEPVDVQMYAEQKIDIHHIFPRDWCDKHGIDRHRRDSIVNKTPLSARTNRKISSNAPTVYLASIERGSEITSERMDEILESHVIDVEPIRADDFGAFFNARRSALLDRIENAMGKPILRSAGADVDAPDEFEMEEDEPWSEPA